MVYTCLNNLAPQYMCNMFNYVTNSHNTDIAQLANGTTSNPISVNVKLMLLFRGFFAHNNVFTNHKNISRRAMFSLTQKLKIMKIGHSVAEILAKGPPLLWVEMRIFVHIMNFRHSVWGCFFTNI